MTSVGPDSSTKMKTLNLDSEGSYAEVLEPSEPCQWAVKISGEGDLGHSASESQTIHFIVDEIPSRSSGIPGFPTQSIALGIFLGHI